MEQGQTHQNVFTTHPQDRIIIPVMNPELEFPDGQEPPAQLFGIPRLNNHNQILVARGLFCEVRIGFFPFYENWNGYFTYLERWDGATTQTKAKQIKLGKSKTFDNTTIFVNPSFGGKNPSPFDPTTEYTRLHDFPAINDFGETVFFGNVEEEKRIAFYSVDYQVSSPLSTPNTLYPMISNQSNIAFKSFLSMNMIEIYDRQLKSITTVGGNAFSLT